MLDTLLHRIFIHGSSSPRKESKAEDARGQVSQETAFTREADVDGWVFLAEERHSTTDKSRTGKTSLVRALSTQLSTAALDKHPQSQQRGITLDLGFSAFRLPPPTPSDPELQVTLVDCPGHASLFRTILGGVAIIDTALLVVDVRKGLQPQTIESLLLAALATQRRVVVALTKVDLLPDTEPERSTAIAAVSKTIREFLLLHFPQFRQQDEDVPVVPVAVGAAAETAGVPELLKALRETLQAPARVKAGPFRLAVDHCFAVPGNGTVLTGTVLSGALQRGDEVELLPLGTTVKVKTLQVFKQEVDRCEQGDRVGVRVNGLDPALVERAVAVSPPGSLVPVTQVVIPVSRVPFFRGPACKSGAKCHATVGHITVIATAIFFTRLGAKIMTSENELEQEKFNPSALYEHIPGLDFDQDQGSDTRSPEEAAIFALLQFEGVVFCPPKALIVCSRLDLNANRYACRLAFYGAVQGVVGLSDDELRVSSAVHSCVVNLANLRVGRVKSRVGAVDKVVASRNGSSGGIAEVIGRDMFAKDVSWSVYQGSVVLFERTRVLGTILGPFGKSGKFRIALVDSNLNQQQATPTSGEKLVLRFLKLTSITPPKVKGKASRVSSISNVKTGKNDSSRSFLQDDRLLYPEAITSGQQPPRVTMPDANAVAKEMDEIPILENPSSELLATNTVNSTRSGRIERLKGETTAEGRNPFAIISGLFDTELEAKAAVGRRVRFVNRADVKHDEGHIEKPFGKAGKVRVDFQKCGGTKGQEGDIVELC
ncbi:hypothetical protein PHYBOEH_004330 [Phytophthora boehmeriae]|uniref:Tr-type G domain-containing protein n=1 Tax=Phytophthora boehmeriae TaxID=109152 RepID=A0A8T1X4W5_9STRA|nr:hypothetical protein PHYBOEH_004330 [Phytophthora boehmeriae]